VTRTVVGAAAASERHSVMPLRISELSSQHPLKDESPSNGPTRSPVHRRGVLFASVLIGGFILCVLIFIIYFNSLDWFGLSH
jgi:hypothetical protein